MVVYVWKERNRKGIENMFNGDDNIIIKIMTIVVLFLGLVIVAEIVGPKKDGSQNSIPDENEVFLNEKKSYKTNRKLDQKITLFEDVSDKEFDAYIETCIDYGFTNVTIDIVKNETYYFKAYKQDSNDEYVYLIYNPKSKCMKRIHTTKI